MKRKISVITASYNSNQDLLTTLKFIRNQKSSKYKSNVIEYIVVDSLSEDGTEQTLQKNKDIIDILICEKDKGLADAWNKGIKVSTGEIIVMLNCGDYFSHHYFDELLDYQYDGKTIYYGNTAIVKDGESINLHKKKFNSFVSHYLQFSFLHTSLITDRFVFNQVGPFSNKYKIATDIEISFGDPSKAKKKLNWQAHYKMRDVIKMMME